MTLIRRDEAGARIVRDDPWVEVADGAELPDAPVIVSLARWREGGFGDREVGVRVPGDVEPDELAPHLAAWSLIAIEFPKFSDGRGYSLARLLHSRYGFRGELRAVGNVLRDQLFYLARCGFTTFALDPRKDPQEALEAFADFSVTYQPAEDHDLPIWRRRA